MSSLSSSPRLDSTALAATAPETDVLHTSGPAENIPPGAERLANSGEKGVLLRKS